MTSDPTLADIKAHLETCVPPGLRGEMWAEDCLIAAHYFAADYYLGEGSNLYAVLVGVDYDPKGRGMADESEDVRELYTHLANAWHQT